MFDSIYTKGNQLQWFQKKVAYFNAAYIKNNDLQWGGGDHKWRLSRVHYNCTLHCVQCTLEKQCSVNHVINVILTDNDHNL